MRGDPHPPIQGREAGDQQKQEKIKENNIGECVALARNCRKDQRFRADSGKKPYKRALGEPYQRDMETQSRHNPKPEIWQGSPQLTRATGRTVWEETIQQRKITM